MENNTVFRWIIVAMFGVIVSLTGFIANNMNSSIDMVAERLHSIDIRLTAVETHYIDFRERKLNQ